jgi:hypothetical protein
MTNDQAAVEKTVHAFYENVSGPAECKRDSDALRGVFCDGATVFKYPSWDPAESHPTAMDAASYVARLTRSLDNACFFERHGGGHTEIGWGVAQVWSRFESTDDPTFASIERTGLNLFQLVRIGSEWKIASLIYEQDADPS